MICSVLSLKCVCYTLNNKKVILGKNDWLFYNNSSDGDPIASYKGTQLFSEEELKKIANNLITTKNNLAQEGCEFILFIAPNKERIYSEYMPDFYGEPSKTYATLQLVEYLKKYTDVKVIYPYNELINAKDNMSGKPLYYKTDTHWNELGSYIGTSVLLNELGIQLPDLNSDNIKIIENENFSGDLVHMLNLSAGMNTEIDYQITGYDKYTTEILQNEFTGAIIYKSTTSDSRKIFMHRDSFGSDLMAKIVGSQFKESYLLHTSAYTDGEIVKEQKPDIFVYELVERYINSLLTFVYE